MSVPSWSVQRLVIGWRWSCTSRCRWSSGQISACCCRKLRTSPAIAWGGVCRSVDGGCYVAIARRQPALPRKSELALVPAYQLFGITMPAVVLGAKRLQHDPRRCAGGLAAGAARPCRPSCGRQRTAVLLGPRSTRWRGCFCPARGPWRGRKWSFMRMVHRGRCRHAVWRALSGSIRPGDAEGCRPCRAGRWGGHGPCAVWDRDTSGLRSRQPVLRAGGLAWFIASQFVVGVAAAVVVLRSEWSPSPPAGLEPTGWPDCGPARREVGPEETA